MSRIDWTQVGNRFFEAGVDRGVLYVGDNAGVPWTGLTEVTESPTIGDTQQYYYDGVNYLNVAGVEEFKATINALYSPEAFDECDGSLYLSRGFKARGQKRRTFGICYRTKIGNDTQGEDYSYKIHLVYNAMAAPAEHTHTSIGEDKEAATLAWDLVTKPVRNAGMAPSAHFVIDASQMHPLHLGLIEDILYGDDENDPRMLTPAEVLDLLETNYEFIQQINLYPDPSHEYGTAPHVVGATPTGTGTLDWSTEKTHSGTHSLKVTNQTPLTLNQTNIYPDPGHEHGIAPFPASPSIGSATAALDTSKCHSGTQSVKLTNTTPLVTPATNLFPDPSLEHGGVSLWTAFAGSSVVDDATHVRTGSHALMVTTSGGGQGGSDASINIPVVSGKTYTFSVWVYNPSTGGAPTGYAIRVAGNVPATNGPNYPDLPRDQWVQHSVTVTATGTGNATFYLYLSNASGFSVWFDDFGVVEGTTPVDFSGDTASGNGATYAWAGTVGNSNSLRTASTSNPAYFNLSIPRLDTYGFVNGDSLTWSIWIYMPAATTAVGAQIRLGSASITPVGGVTVTNAQRDQWVKISYTVTVVDVTKAAAFWVYTGNMPGDVMWVDDFAIEKGATTSDFNGDTPTDGTYVYAWTGAPGASPSTKSAKSTGVVASNKNITTQVSTLGFAVGDLLTFSGWVYIPSGVTPGAATLRLSGGAVAAFNVPAPTVRDQWVRVWATETVIADSNFAVGIYSGSKSNDFIYYDDFTVSKTAAPIDDFNGDTPAVPQEPVGNLAYRWEGIPGQSPSDEFMQFGVVELINVYPDPSHEYGLAPFDDAFDSGSGTVELDTTDSHTGTQSVKMTNVTPSQVLLENIFPDPGAEYGLNGWHAYVDGSVTQDYSQVRTGSSSLKTTSITQPATAHMDTALEDSNGNSILARNTQYTVVVWGRVDASAPNQWQIRYNTGAGTATQDSPLSTTPKGNWGRLSFTFTTQPTGLDGLYIRTPAAPANVWIDDMALIQGPLPVLDAVDFVQANNFPTDVANQGIAYDGTYYYTVVSQTIRKYSRNWTLQASREVSADISAASTNHVSAPYVLNGQIIIPIHNDPNPAIIGRWNASDLSFVSATLVTGGVDTASAALSYDPAVNEFLIPGYYSGEHNLERFDANFNYLGYINSPVNFPQGILVYEDRYYIHGDWPGGVTTDNPNGRGLISIKKDGTDPRMIVPEPIQELEGICVGEDSTFVLLGNNAGQLTINQYKILGSGFNGDTPSNAEGIGYVWVGTPGASHSRRIKLGQGTGYSALSLGTLASMGFQNGDPITWSAWVKIPTGSTPDIYVLQLGPANDAVTTAAAVPPPDDRDTWVKVSGSTTVKDATKTPLFWVYAATKTGEVIRYDDFAIEKVDADTGTTDFNGDTLSTPYTSDGRYNYHWVGDPGVSPSEMILSQI